jgi:tRNA U34 5-carboxymethylaminomethyl modifying GTPase MnmE/TrmE
LTGELSLAHSRCVLFDCAGLTGCPSDERRATSDELILDELAQQAAIEALRNSSVVVFCVDVSKADWAEDVAVRGLIGPKTLIPVATKCDLLPEQKLARRLARLSEIFGSEFVRHREPVGMQNIEQGTSKFGIQHSVFDIRLLLGVLCGPFLPISAKTGAGLDRLRAAIDTAIVSCQSSIGDRQSSILLTARHRQAIADAIQNIGEAVDELKSGNDEVAAMLLRAAYQCICDIHQPVAGRLNEQILQQIFSRFCIGK